MAINPRDINPLGKYTIQKTCQATITVWPSLKFNSPEVWFTHWVICSSEIIMKNDERNFDIFSDNFFLSITVFPPESSILYQIKRKIQKSLIYLDWMEAQQYSKVKKSFAFSPICFLKTEKNWQWNQRKKFLGKKGDLIVLTMGWR